MNYDRQTSQQTTTYGRYVRLLKLLQPVHVLKGHVQSTLQLTILLSPCVCPSLVYACMCNHISCPDWQRPVTNSIGIDGLCAMIITNTMCCFDSAKLLRLTSWCWSVFLVVCIIFCKRAILLHFECNHYYIAGFWHRISVDNDLISLSHINSTPKIWWKENCSLGSRLAHTVKLIIMLTYLWVRRILCSHCWVKTMPHL